MKIFKRIIILMMLAAVLQTTVYAERIDRALFKKIEANLMCTDGCGMYLKVCENATAQKMRKDIISMLSNGMNENQIYAKMIATYGEEAMASPPISSKFNIIAWAGPFVAIIVGFIVIYICLDRWIFNNKKGNNGGRVNEEELEEYSDFLDNEIKKHY